MILGAAYMLYLYRRVIFGVITRADVRAMADLTPLEVAIFAPMIAIVLWMGIYPGSFMRPMQPALAKIIAGVQTSERAHGAKFALAPPASPGQR
jgi:NADH-quinone oxidoreductase subunit M